VLKGISWEPTQTFSRGDAVDQLQRLVFEFDRNLRPDEVKRRNGEVAVVWFRPVGAGAVIAVDTASGVDGNILLVRCSDEDVKRAVEGANAGTFVIDVNCDVVLDEQMQPVSSCMTGLIGTHVPRPGGIMRTWLSVRG
jgi:hypothetical protein